MGDEDDGLIEDEDGVTDKEDTWKTVLDGIREDETGG